MVVVGGKLEEEGEVLLGPKNQPEAHELKNIWKINSARRNSI